MLEVVFIGAGRAGNRHARALGHAGLTCAGVFDVDADAAHALGRGLGVRVFERIDDALRVATGGIAVISTPPGTHVDLVQAAAAAGMHVLVEKPAGGTPASALEMADAARRGGVHVGVVAQHRYAQGPRMLREHARAAGLGRPLSVHVRVRRRRVHDASAGWRTDPTLAVGGVLVSIGFHYLDLACWILGGVPTQVRVVHCQADNGLDSRIEATFQLGFVQGHVSAAWGDLTNEPDRMTIRGDLDEAVLVGDRWLRDGTEPERRTTLLARQLREFASAVAAGTAPPVTPTDVLPALDLVARAYEQCGLRRVSVETKETRQ